MLTNYCRYCNKRLSSERLVYCGAECRKAYFKQLTGKVVIRQCQFCQKEYRQKRASQKFCSTQCALTATKHELYNSPNMQTLIDVVDCLPSTDMATLNKLWRERSLDIAMLIRKVLKLKIEMKRR